MYVRASSARECLAFLLLAFCLTWTVWIPVLLVSRTHEQLGDLLVLGTLDDLRRGARGNRNRQDLAED